MQFLMLLWNCVFSVLENKVRALSLLQSSDTRDFFQASKMFSKENEITKSISANIYL